MILSSTYILSHRFVLPVLPIALMFSGYALAKMKASGSPDTERKGSLNIYTRCPSKIQFSILFLLATNIPMALYMSLVHQVHQFPLQWNKAVTFCSPPPVLSSIAKNHFCLIIFLGEVIKLFFLVLCVFLFLSINLVNYNYRREKNHLQKLLEWNYCCFGWYINCKRGRQRGTEDVMIYLSKEACNEKVKSILFLMPCHATPYYSTLHRNLPMRFLDCSPRFGSLAKLIPRLPIM